MAQFNELVGPQTLPSIVDAVEPTEFLARVLGLGPWEVADNFGSPWEDTEAPQGLRWLVAGVPPQVMLEIDEEGHRLRVCRPDLHWNGVYAPALRPSKVYGEHRLGSAIDLDALAEDVASAVRAERRRFRWCRYCLRLTEPGYMQDPRVCMGCAEQHQGVVH